MQDPARYLTELGVSLTSATDEQRTAILDADHRSYVNWEVFFFADLEEKVVFERDPVRFCGVVTDPVSKKRFRPAIDSPRVDYAGRPYFFQTKATLEQFESMPDGLANPMHKMIPKKESGSPSPSDSIP